jgi:S-adenosylmethionine hydrolase
MQILYVEFGTDAPTEREREMGKIGLATLMTDFGTSDPYVAAMKGVILGKCPVARVVDICHDIPPHDVMAGAFVWAHATPYFPEGTIHVGVVDPGVGTERAVLAAVLGGQIFLMPDNGLISLVGAALPLEAIVVVQNEKYLPQVGTSRTFDGRDVFAPLAGEIMNGLDIHDLGTQPQTYKTLDIPDPLCDGDSLVGQVLYVDRFGNLISPEDGVSVLAEHRPGAGKVPGGAARVSRRYPGVGQPLALFNSMDLVEVAVNQEKASDVLEAGVGAEVRISPQLRAMDALDHGTGGE